MARWQFVNISPRGHGLGKIAYRHIHDDESAHEAQHVVPGNVGVVFVPGQPPPGQVFCLSCGAELEPDDTLESISE